VLLRKPPPGVLWAREGRMTLGFAKEPPATHRQTAAGGHRHYRMGLTFLHVNAIGMLKRSHRKRKLTW